MRTPQPSRVQKKKFKGRKSPQCEDESMERIKTTFWPLKYLYLRGLISSFLVHKSWEIGDCVQTADEEHQFQATETRSARKWVSEWRLLELLCGSQSNSYAPYQSVMLVATSSHLKFSPALQLINIPGVFSPYFHDFVTFQIIVPPKNILLFLYHLPVCYFSSINLDAPLLKDFLWEFLAEGCHIAWLPLYSILRSL